MKEIEYLVREQAVLHFYIIFLLAAIQEYALNIETILSTYCNKSKEFDIYVFKKRYSQTSLNFCMYEKHSIVGNSLLNNGLGYFSIEFFQTKVTGD